MGIGPPVRQRRFNATLSTASSVPTKLIAWGIGVATLIPICVIVILALNDSIFLGFPVQGISLQWFKKVLESSDWRRSFKQSFTILVMSAPLATALGTCGALGLRSFRHTSWIQPIFLLPLIVPVVVTALMMFPFYSDTRLLGTTTGLVIVHALLALPFTFMILWGATHSLNPSLERAAESLGANLLRTLLRVVLPLLWPAVLGALVVAAVVSFDETVATLFLADATTKTVPIQIYLHIANDFSPAAAAASTMTLLVNLFMMTTVTLLVTKSLRARLGR